MSHLEDQVVLVTGCSSGIGRALAKEFAQRGHRAFASARRLEAIADLKGDRLDTVQLDVTDVSSIDAAVTQVTERAGKVDIVVNNAGFNVFGPLAELPLDRVKSLFDTNVTAPLALVQRLFPAMAARGSGRIVNIGSVVGELPTPFAGAYCASKAALHMLSDVLRMELSPFGIDVIVVQPAAVRSNIAEAGSVGTRALRERGIALPRRPSPDREARQGVASRPDGHRLVRGSAGRSRDAAYAAADHSPGQRRCAVHHARATAASDAGPNDAAPLWFGWNWADSLTVLAGSDPE